MNGAWTRWWRLAALPGLAALTACSTCPPFRASWYVDDDRPGADRPPTVYLALLHQGRQPVVLSQVIVNPQGGAGSLLGPFAMTAARPDGGRLVVLPAKERRPDTPATAEAEAAQDQRDNDLLGRPARLSGSAWQPGQLLVFRVRDRDPAAACSVPLVVQIHCGDGCARVEPVSGALPNYLHSAWIQRCNPVVGAGS